MTGISISLEDAARQAWADQALRHRWTLWTRLTWAHHISELRASRVIEEWTHKMAVLMPGFAAIVGLHNDTERLHAHVLLFIPDEVARPVYEGVKIVGWNWTPWLARHWRHGDVWTDRYSPGPSTKGQRAAALYLARDVGSVMQYGTPPVYQPDRKSRRR